MFAGSRTYLSGAVLRVDPYLSCICFISRFSTVPRDPRIQHHLKFRTFDEHKDLCQFDFQMCFPLYPLGIMK